MEKSVACNSLIKKSPSSFLQTRDKLKKMLPLIEDFGHRGSAGQKKLNELAGETKLTLQHDRDWHQKKGKRLIVESVGVLLGVLQTFPYVVVNILDQPALNNKQDLNFVGGISALVGSAILGLSAASGIKKIVERIKVRNFIKGTNKLIDSFSKENI